MRINRFVANASGLSRRAADQLIKEGRVKVDNVLAITGQDVTANNKVVLDSKLLKLPESTILILYKPVSYVVSRKGQGSPTIYSLLPEKYRMLKTVGRLDKDSSGLLLLTNDGTLAQSLTHPKFEKTKTYEVSLNKTLSEQDRSKLIAGVRLDDGLSKLAIPKNKTNHVTVIIHEGRKRQIRRSFEAIGYKVVSLHRTTFGEYILDNLKPGEFKEV